MLHQTRTDLLLLVPKGERDVHAAMGITNTCNAVFTPPKGTAAGLVVGEVGPSIAVWSVSSQSGNEAIASLEDLRIVFSDRSPLPLGGVAAPSLPVFRSVSVFSETPLFSTEHVLAVGDDHCVVSAHLGGERRKHDSGALPPT